MSVLVAYASKHGATQGIAERIAEQLRLAGKEVVVRPVDAAGDVGAYEAAVIGSAVYFGAWMKEAAEFVRRNRAALAERPVWLFSSGPVGDAALPEPRDVAEFQAAIHPRAHHTFAGTLDRHALSFSERVIAKVVQAPEGDFRNWQEIDAWANDIAQALVPRGASPSPASPA